MCIPSFISVVELHECRFVIILYLAILVHSCFFYGSCGFFHSGHCGTPKHETRSRACTVDLQPLCSKLLIVKHLLQASLPVTTYCQTENKLAEISSSLRQSELIQKDYSQSKLIIKSADLTEDGYPRTLNSCNPSDNVIKTSAKVTRQAAEITWGWSRLGNDNGIERGNPKHRRLPEGAGSIWNQPITRRFNKQ